jgi:hypothetical protein
MGLELMGAFLIGLRRDRLADSLRISEAASHMSAPVSNSSATWFRRS